jgi:hypothetical protein
MDLFQDQHICVHNLIKLSQIKYYQQQNQCCNLGDCVETLPVVLHIMHYTRIIQIHT